jgi:hypothetical protein
MKFSKFRYGMVGNLSNSCGEDEMDGGLKILGMGFMTYKGLYCLIYGFLCRGCVATSFPMHPFSKPFYGLLFFKMFPGRSQGGDSN